MQLTFDHIEGNVAILLTEAGEPFRVLQSELPEELTHGDTVDVTFHLSSDDATPQTQQARTILNELLGTNQSDADA
jgi:hypothetical protein